MKGDNQVHLDPMLFIPSNLGFCSQVDKNVVLMSTGNHKTRSGFGGRWGVNNATIYQGNHTNPITLRLILTDSFSLCYFRRLPLIFFDVPS
jgi:hypothetical protein